jgi:hypothetical protein
VSRKRRNAATSASVSLIDSLESVIAVSARRCAFFATSTSKDHAHEGGGGHALVEVDLAVCEEGGVEACVSGDGSDSVVLLGHAPF